MIVDMLHGCVERDTGAQSCRNFVGASALRRYLQGGAPYEAWTLGRTTGRCLTVDDATKGAAHACEIARSLGHEVMLFVNPFQVATGAPYFFTLLDAVLEARRGDDTVYLDQRYDLSDRRQLRSFRLAVRQSVWRRSESDAVAAVLKVARTLGVSDPCIPEHAQPLTIEELQYLRDIGVRLENHGWTHIEIGLLNAPQFSVHIAQARRWCWQHLHVDLRHYAVPFGLASVHAEIRHEIEGMVFLANPELPLGETLGDQWNRADITSTLKSAPWV